MTEIADRYRRLASAFAEEVAAVPADRWSAPSPCEDWTALDVVRHVVETHGMFEGLVNRSIGDTPSVDEDPLAAWTAARDVVQAIDRFIAGNLVIHGWDLARATGQDDRLDPAELQRCWDEIPTFGDTLRSSGVFGPAVEPPPGADEQDRLLSFLGRHV